MSQIWSGWYEIHPDGTFTPVASVRDLGRQSANTAPVEEGGRTVAKTSVVIGDRTLWVSTVFLGVDHSFRPGPPVLFETMVFEGSMMGRYCKRYHTYGEAKKGHEEVVKGLLDGTVVIEEDQEDEG